MPLTTCSDCGGQVSTEALACPACGRPVSSTSYQPDPSRGSAEPGIVRTPKSRGAYIALGLFLGPLGVHNFYAGYRGKGAAQLIISLLLGWVFGIGIIITSIWALVEVISVRNDAHGNPMT